jgi:hypothetical protein
VSPVRCELGCYIPEDDILQFVGSFQIPIVSKGTWTTFLYQCVISSKANVRRYAEEITKTKERLFLSLCSNTSAIE